MRDPLESARQYGNNKRAERNGKATAPHAHANQEPPHGVSIPSEPQTPQSEYDDRLPGDRGSDGDVNDQPRFAPVALGKLLSQYQDMRPTVIDGLLRVGEICNLIAPPKFGKSWLILSLALSVATGRPWLSFPTTKGKVLLIDNELHPETLANRFRRVADIWTFLPDEIADTIDVLSLRGNLQDLNSLGMRLRSAGPFTYKLVVIDAFYRTLPEGTDENSNAGITSVYNLLDRLADQLQAAFVLNHHASKGNQSSKAVTDVGAGAGAQSRAADTHLILRPHEEKDVYVLDGATRSFPPIVPKCLRWTWPYFSLAEDLDPADLLDGKRRRGSAPKNGEERKSPKKTNWTVEQFVERFGADEPKSQATLLYDAEQAGMSGNKAKQLLDVAIDNKLLFAWRENGANTPLLIARKPPSVPDVEKPKTKRQKPKKNT